MWRRLNPPDYALLAGSSPHLPGAKCYRYFEAGLATACSLRGAQASFRATPGVLIGCDRLGQEILHALVVFCGPRGVVGETSGGDKLLVG